MKLSELAKELKCATSTLTRLVKTGAIHANPDGSVDRDRALLEITRNTSGSGGGWDGRPGRVSLYDRAKALLNKGNASSRRTASPKESSCSGARDILGLSEADLATILGDLDDTPTTDDDTVLEQFLIRYGMMRLCEHILGKKQQGAFIGCAMDAGASREQAKQHAAVFAYLTCLWVADLLNHEKWFDPELAAKFRQDVQSWGEKNILWRDEPK